MKERKWILVDKVVVEHYEYKNLGVLKNCRSSFDSNISDSIEKMCKKACMISSSYVDRRKANTITNLCYVILWRQAFDSSLSVVDHLLSPHNHHNLIFTHHVFCRT